MAEEREAVYRVRTERTGDEEAISGVGREIEEAAQAAERAGSKATLSPLLEQLRAVDQEGAEAFEALASEHEELRRVLEQPIDFALAKARRDADEFAEAVGEGASSAADRAAALRRSLDLVTEASRALARSGQGMTDAHERELEDLEDAYRSLIREQARVRASQAQVDRDLGKQLAGLGEYGAAIQDYGDLLNLLPPKLQKVAGVLGVVTSGLTAGYDAGTRFREFLAEVDGALGTDFRQQLDESAQAVIHFFDVFDRLEGRSSDPSTEFDLMRNALQQLRAEGLEPVSGNLDEVIAQLESYRRAQADASLEANAQRAATEKWAAGLGLSRAELDQTASALATFVTRFLEQNDALDQAEFAESIRPQLERLLDAYKTLGAEAPAELQKIASALGIVDSETRAGLETIAGYLDEYRSRLADAMGGVVEDANERRQALEQALGELRFEEVNFLPPEEREKLRAQLDGMLQDLRAVGGELTPELQAIAGAVGLVVAAWEPVAPAADAAASGMQNAADASRDGADATRDLIAEVERKREILRGSKEATDEEAAASEDAASSTSESAEAQRDLVAEVERKRESLRGAAEAAREDAGASSEAAGAASEHAGAEDEVASAAERKRAALEEAQRAAEEGAGASERAAEGTKKGAEALGEQAKAAEQAATASQGAATETERLGQAQSQLAAQGQQIAASVDQIAQKLGTLETSVASLPQALSNAFADPSALFAPWHLELDALVSKAESARSVLGELTDAEAAA